jgi:hypothetical protein
VSPLLPLLSPPLPAVASELLPPPPPPPLPAVASELSPPLPAVASASSSPPPPLLLLLPPLLLLLLLLRRLSIAVAAPAVFALRPLPPPALDNPLQAGEALPPRLAQGSRYRQLLVPSSPVPLLRRAPKQSLCL